VPEIPEEAEPQPWHDLYWSAWEALSSDRQYGAFGGESRVPFTALDRYARRYGITGQAFDTFIRLFGEIDDEWLAWRAEKAKKDEERRRGGRRE
jgi:hypothetical protein